MNDPDSTRSTSEPGIRVPVRLLCAALTAAAISSPAAAEDWQTKFIAYLMLPWTDFAVTTPSGTTLETSANPVDLLEALEFGAMFAGETRKGKVSLLYDVFYSGLGTNGTLSGPLGSTYDVDVDLLLTSFAVGYDLKRSENDFSQVFGGFRYAAMDNALSVGGGGPVGITVGLEQDVDYFEPLIGFRAGTRIGPKTMLNGYIDVGGFGVGSELTWDGYIGIDHAISERTSAIFGARYLSIDYEGAAGDFDLELSGPVVGISWTF